MAEGGYDFAVCGSTPFAILLAGLLATAENRRVCLIGEPWSPYRLPLLRSLRRRRHPAETWTLLKRETPVLRLLNSVGRGLFSASTPCLPPRRPRALTGSATCAGRRPPAAMPPSARSTATVTETGTICRIRDGHAGRRPHRAGARRLAGLDRRRASAGARRADRPRRDGTATIAFGGDSREAGALVLADDEAILAHQPAADRHRLIAAVPQRPSSASRRRGRCRARSRSISTARP